MGSCFRIPRWRGTRGAQAGEAVRSARARAAAAMHPAALLAGDGRRVALAAGSGAGTASKGEI
jgi:hypothetical protein